MSHFDIIKHQELVLLKIFLFQTIKKNEQTESVIFMTKVNIKKKFIIFMLGPKPEVWPLCELAG